MNDLTIKLGLDDSGLPPPVKRVNEAIATIGKTGEISARQTAAAMRTLPAQFTDIATQLAGGQNPLLILLQQGGQIKDSFGGIGPTIAALKGYITPTAVGIAGLAAGVGALALAARQGYVESNQLRDSLALTGNAAGLTGARFAATAEVIAAATNQTIGGAREIVLDLAANGQVSNRVLSSMAVAVGRIADVTGTDSKKVSADFATMTGGVAKWAAEHNKAWNFITVEQYRYIRRLEEQGKAEQAMIVTNELVTKHLEGQRKSLGFLETAWLGVRKTASDAWDSMLGIGRETTTRQQLDAAIKRLEGITTGTERDPRKIERAQQAVQLLKEQLKLENQQADSQSRRAQAEREAIAEERKGEGKGRDLPGGAIQSAREQYRNDFLRSEKDLYDELDKQRRKDFEQGLKDPLGEFITEKVLPEDKARQERRLAQNAQFLQALIDGNERAGLELIADERARGEALIALDRDIAQRQLVAQGVEGGARDEAIRLLDEQALLKRRRLEVDLRSSADRLADEAGKSTYDGVRDALSAAFRDSSDPVRAFGNALASTIYSRATASLVDALATAAVGRDGNGGGWGQLIGYLGGLVGGGMTVDTGGIGITPADGSTALPTRGGMATGTNRVPRNMLTFLHEGEAVIPAKYNPANGGVGGGLTVNHSTNISIDARTDAAQVAQIAFQAAQQSNTALVEYLQSQRLIAA